MRILIAAGGTGGHVYPALAVARSLRERVPDVEFQWLGGHRGLESNIVPVEGFPLDLLPLRSLRTVDLNHHAVLDPARLAASLPVAEAKLLRWRPDAVFTTGGYVAIPVVMAAASQRVPSVMWEGNIVAGRSVRATARFANVLAVSFAETAKSLPGRCYVTGTPIRSFAGHDRASAREALHLEPDTPVVFVFGGSQQVRRMNRAVWDALLDLVKNTQIIHMTGEPAYADALKAREKLPTGWRSRYKPYPFLRSEMTDALVASDMLVGRAGSSTLAEASALGLPMVVVPYPHASAHQVANARALAEAGAARIVADEDFNADALKSAVEIIHDEGQVATMRAASRTFGRPGAASAVAELVLALAERATLPSDATIEQMSKAAA
jgi:UDP-N-acetylglucosamine--N-acetylmuramyl-(pentapeptide) pyrophosphoryl-undecaprenol N-acetylglucosamine transferase